MNKLQQIISEVLNEKNVKEKITRQVFLYYEPKGNKSKFAQCETCRMFTGDKCSILGNTKITKDMSCNLYVHGQPSLTLKGKEIESVTPTEVGLVNRQVRCENCRSFNKEKSSCMLFENLNKTNSDIFNLEEKVNVHGCCNAQMSK
jgi:hypothetical protein